MFIVSWVATPYSSVEVQWRFGTDNDFLCNASQLMRPFGISVPWRLVGWVTRQSGELHALHPAAPSQRGKQERPSLLHWGRECCIAKEDAETGSDVVSPLKATGVEFLTRNCMQFPPIRLHGYDKFYLRPPDGSDVIKANFQEMQPSKICWRGESERTKTVWIQLQAVPNLTPVRSWKSHCKANWDVLETWEKHMLSLI
jgi:hypothetical protein